jgi:hypothetical protein
VEASAWRSTQPPKHTPLLVSTQEKRKDVIAYGHRIRRFAIQTQIRSGLSKSSPMAAFTI